MWRASTIETTITVAFVGLLGVLVGGLLTSHAGRLSRRLELYKTVFPEKFAKACAIMDSSQALVKEVGEYFDLPSGTTIPNETWRALRNKLNDFGYSVEGCSWLFGAKVTQAARNLDRLLNDALHQVDRHQAEWKQNQRVEAIQAINEARMPYRIASAEAIARLAEAIQKEIRVTDFSGL